MNTETGDAPPLDDAWIELQAALAEAEIVDLVHPFDEHDEAWVIAMLRSLRAMERKVGEIQQTRREYVEQAREEAAHFQERAFDSLTREAANRRAVLAEWALAQRHETGRASWSFPGGLAIKTTHTSARWSWPDDDAALVAQIEEAGQHDLVRVKKSVDKPAVKAAEKKGLVVVKDDRVLLAGEPLEGVSVGDETVATVVL